MENNQNTNKMITYELVYKVLQASLFRKEISFPEDTDWNAVYQEMEHHRIIPMAGIWLNTSPVPAQLKNDWIVYIFNRVRRWKAIMENQHYLIYLLKEDGISIAIMKGSAVGVCFPMPEHRPAGDIDFLVAPEDFDRAAELLEKDGFVLIEKAPYHWEYEKNGVSFEMHHFPSGMEADDTYLMGLFQEGLKNLEMKQYRGYEFSSLPVLQNGLVLLLHIVHHLHSGMGLRQICDWMMYAHTYLDDDYYYREMQPVLQKANLETLAKMVTKACQMHLGLRKDITWCNDIDDSYCNELIEYVMDSGNFGRKKDDETKSEAIFTTRLQYYKKNPLMYFKGLQENGKKEWKLLEKAPFFTPFAWAYKIFSSIKKLFKVWKQGDMAAEMKEADKREHLFSALDLTYKYMDKNK